LLLTLQADSRKAYKETIWRILAHSSRSGLMAALSLAVGMAVFWWLVVVLVIKPAEVLPVWGDQKTGFTQVPHHLADPYEVSRFSNAPWTAIFLIPFGEFSLSLAVLLQLIVYFVSLTLLIFRYGGNIRTVILALTSFIALDNAIELNIEWIICIGLLVPAALSGPFLLTKPQLALGVWMSYSRRQLIGALSVTAILLVLSGLIWPNWPAKMQESIQQNILTDEYIGQFNLAPLSLMPIPLSLTIGGLLAWRGIRRRDPIFSILAWFFFVPYIPFYSLLFYLALLGIRFPKLAWIIHVCMWVIYGGIILIVLLFR
jgi:hypothetical protein